MCQRSRFAFAIEPAIAQIVRSDILWARAFARGVRCLRSLGETGVGSALANHARMIEQEAVEIVVLGARQVERRATRCRFALRHAGGRGLVPLRLRPTRAVPAVTAARANDRNISVGRESNLTAARDNHDDDE